MQFWVGKSRGQTGQLKATLGQIRQSAGLDYLSRPPESLLELVVPLHRALIQMRGERRNLRFEIRRAVETLGTRLTILNLIAGPLLVICWAFIAAWWRRRQTGRWLSVMSNH